LFLRRWLIECIIVQFAVWFLTEFLEELTFVAVSARYEDMELTDSSEIYTKSVVEEYMEKALPIIEKLRGSIQS
jgi:HEPN domain-containing protein